MLLDYTHEQLNREIIAIGGHYMFLKEASLPFQGKVILYLVGCAVFNSTCCGSGGISFARVQGFLHRHKYKKDPSGREISLIEPITGDVHQAEIRKIVQQKEMVPQVEFS